MAGRRGNGQAVRQAAEAAADGLDRQVQQGRGERRGDDRDQHAGPRRPIASENEDQGRRSRAQRQRSPGRWSAGRGPSAASLGISGPGSAPARCRPPRSFSWLAAMVTAMPQVKPTVTACGICRISEPSLKHAQQRQHQARHQHGQQQAVDAEAGDRGGHQHDEGAGRPADLEPAAAQQRDDKAADDGGVEPALGRDAGRHRDRHR